MRKPFTGRSFLKQLAFRKGLSIRKQLRRQLRGRKPMFESLEQRTVFATAVLPTVNLGQPIKISEGFGYGSTIAGLGSAIDTMQTNSVLVGELTEPLGIENTGKFTFESWVYPDPNPNRKDGVIWISGVNNQAIRIDNYQFRRVNDTGLQVRIRGASQSDDITIDVTANNVLNRDAWNHLAITYDGNRLLLYVNGVNVASQVAPNQQLRPINRVDFQGKNRKTDSTSFGAGAIDEVRIWNVARSQADIQESMLTQLKGNEDGLAAYWNFDNPSPSPSNQELSATKNANALEVTASPRLLNAAPQIGYVDVLVDSPVTSPVGLWVTYDVTQGDAKSGIDFIGSSFRKSANTPSTELNGIIIPQGASRGRIYVSAIHDAISEPTESFLVTLKGYSFDGKPTSDYNLGGTPSARVDIIDGGEFKIGAAITDSTGRAVTTASKLFVDPVTRQTTFKLQLTSSPFNPNLPSPNSNNLSATKAYLTLTASPQGALDNLGRPVQSISVEFSEDDWYIPRTFKLLGVTGEGSITLRDTFAVFPYLTQPLTFPFTTTPPTEARAEEGSETELKALTPTVNLLTVSNLVENSDQPARVRVQLNTPAPKGGLDVFYSVTSSANTREGVHFKKLPGLIHVEEGLLEAEIPIQSINDINVLAGRWIDLTLAARTTYTNGTAPKARVTYKEDDIARVVISNPVTVDITTPKSLARPVTTIEEGFYRYLLNDSTLSSAGTVGSFDNPAWTATGGLSASFTPGQRDTDAIPFGLAQKADSTTKITVKFIPATANGQTPVTLRKTGADGVNSVATSSMFDIASVSGTRLYDEATNTPRYPVVVSDNTLEWNLAGLPAGAYRLVLATHSNVRNFLAPIPGVSEFAFDYEARFTSNPTAPYQMFTTKTVTNFSNTYAPLVTAEPVPEPIITSEPNNSVATASALGVARPDYVVSSQTVDSGSDVDFFQFTLDKNSGRPDTLVAVFARPAGGTNPLLMDLLSSSGAVLVSGTARPQNQFIDLTGLADGTYVVRVKPAAPTISSTNYALKFRTIFNPSEPDGNERFSSATYLGVVADGDRFNDLALTRQGDVDNYRFTLNTALGRPTSLSVLSSSVDGNVYAALYNSAGNFVIANPPSNLDTKTISLAGLIDGDYFLQVKGDDPGTLNNYDVAFGTFTPRQRDINPNQFAVRLSAQPTANVAVVLSTANRTQGRFNTSTLTFSPSNWNQFQNVVVTPLDDGVFNGDVTYTVKATPTSADPSFANQLTNFDIINLDRGNFVQPAEVSTVDETDKPIVSISRLSASPAIEGQQAAFRISLNRASPTPLNVTLDFSRSTAVEDTNFRLSGAINTKSPHKVTIPAGATSHDIYVNILNDQVQNSASNSRLSVRATVLDEDGYRPAQTIDPGYSAAVEIVDINAAGFSIRNADSSNALATTLLTDETAATPAKKLTIALQSKPKADTTVILSSSLGSEAVLSTDPNKAGTSTLKLVFTKDNWNQPQSFWVKGVNDLIADGNTSFRIGVSAMGEDEVYRSLSTVYVNGVNSDNDTASIAVSSPQATVNDRSNVFSVKLNTQPVGQVRVTMTPRNDQVAINEGRAGDPSTLKFDAINWNIPQLVKVVAVDDKVVEFLHQSQIDFTVETGLHLDGLSSAANTTRETAIDLGILDGGLRWNNLVMRASETAPTNAPVQEQWIKFTLDRPTSLTNVLRLDALGDNWDTLPDVNLLDASGAFLRAGVKTNVQYGPNNTLFKRAFTELGLQSLQAGTYYLSMKNGFANRLFSLKLNAADAAFESVNLPSVRVSIKDNDLPIAEIIAGPTASEVFSQPSYFAVRLNAPAPAGPADSGVVVNFKVSGGRASQGSSTSIEHDYTVLADEFDTSTGIGWVRVAPGNTTANIGIFPVDDKLVEDVPVQLLGYDAVTKSILLTGKPSFLSTSNPPEPSYSFSDGTKIAARTSLGQEVSFTVNKTQAVSLDSQTGLYKGRVNVILSTSDEVIVKAQGAAEMAGRVRSEDVQITLLGGTNYVLPLAPNKQDSTTSASADLDSARTRASLTIFDDDVPGIRWIELQDNTTVAEGGVTTFQVSLTSEPSFPVDVTLTPGVEFAIVDPLRSTVADIPVTRYNLVTTGVDSNLKLTLLSVDETDKGVTATIDARLSRATLGATARKETFEVKSGTTTLGSVTFDVPGINDVDFAGNPVNGRFDVVQRLTLSGLQRGADNAFSLTGNFEGRPSTLRLEPKPVEIIQVNTTTLTFSPSEWFKPQTITIRGLNDSVAEPGAWHREFIRYSTNSADVRWNALSVNNQEIHILDTQFDVGATVDGLQGTFGALEDSLDGLKIPLVGSVGELSAVDSLFDQIETPLIKSVATQDTLSAGSFEEVAESSLNPLVRNGIVDVLEITPSADPNEVRVAIHLEKLIHVGTVGLDSSLGLDGLGIQFNTTGVATLDLEISVDLAFGWHHQFGFYIDTDMTAIHVGAKLTLQGSGATEDNPENLFTGMGSFGFLQLKFNDDPSNPTELAITLDAKLRDLDNVNTIKFFDINGDGILADTPILYDVGTDANNDGRIDLDADGNQILRTTTLAAIEPFQTIGGKGSTESFPTVAQITAGGDTVRGANDVNWNKTTGKGTTFDESESVKNEGIYQVLTKGTQSLVFLDRNRNGKLDVGARKIDPFTTSWTSLTNAQKTSSEVWFTPSNPKRIRELRILTKGAGASAQYYLDVNQNNVAELSEGISPKLRKKLDKNSNGTIEADVNQDGEGAFQQGTSTAFFDSNGNAKQDFSEPFISYSFEDFELSTDLLSEDAALGLFFDLNGNGLFDFQDKKLFDVNDIRVGESADKFFLDFDGKGSRETSEPESLKSDQVITIPSTIVDEATMTATFGTYTFPVITVDGERFIDFNGDGELTLNEDGEPLEPKAGQRTTLSDFDIERFVLRMKPTETNFPAPVAMIVEKLRSNQPVTVVERASLRDAYNGLVTSRKVFELPSDGDRLTLKELNVFRASVRGAHTTKSEQLKAAASELFVYTFQGYANIGMNTRTSIQESSLLPAVQFDLAVNVPLFNLSNDEESDENGFSVEFRNVAVDLGSFLRDYMVPILATANDALGPIKPIVKALNADTKLLGKLGLSSFFESDGKPGISLLEIAKKLNTGGSAQAAKIDKAIKFADQITTLVNTIDSLSQTVTTESSLLEFGTINLNDLRAGSSNPANAASQARVMKRADSAPAASIALPATTASDIDSQAKKSSKFRDKYNALKNVEGLSIELFNPSTVLSLIMGESNVNLITYDIPDFSFAFDIAKEFKIWGPIAGKLEGGFSIATDLSMGFDTSGLEAWAAQGFDPLKSYLALDGIYFDDWNPAGAEKDELTVKAYIAAGVGLDIGIASGFVKGGVEGIVGLDIVDVGERSGTSDGKIRGSDFVEKLSSSPTDLFDLTGTVNAFLGAEVSVNLLFFKQVVYKDRLATIELAKFKLSESGGSTNYPGRVQTGPISGGTVWFDANNNFTLDPGEYSTQTDAEGTYALELPDDLDISTGTIRASGGRDASTGTANLANLVVPSGSRGNATALTALQAALVTSGKVSLEESQSKIKSALGIDSSIDLSTFAHIDQALAGNEKAAPVLLATNVLNTVAMQLSSTLEGAMGVGLNNPRYSGLLSKAVFSAMADELASGSLDLTATDRLQRILTNSVAIANELLESVGSTDRVDIAFLSNHQSTILAVIRASVLNILALAQRAKNVIDLEQKITKAKVNLNDKTPADLYQLIRGTKSAADVLRDNARTDTAYLDFIEQVKLPPLISPIRNINVLEDERIPSIPFTVRRQSTGADDLQMTVTSDNPALLPPNSMAIQFVYKDPVASGYRLQIVPAAYRFGSANITLRIVDPQGGVQTQTFKLDVGHVNHAPEVTNDSVVGPAGRRITLNPLANDIDRDGDKLTLRLVSMPADGLTVVNPDGTISYTSNPDARGRRDFVYQVSDGAGKTATARIMLDLVEGPRGVAIEQTATPTSAAGHEIVYQLTLTNLGLTSANNIVVTDVLPSPVVFSSIVLPPGFTATTPAENRGGTVTVRGASLPADASVTLWIIGRVPTNFGSAGTVVNTATVQSSVVNPDTPRTTARASTRLNTVGAALAPSTAMNVHDLVITGSAGADQIVVSQNASRGINVDIGGQRQGTFQVTGSILVYAGAGNDNVTIDPSVTRPAFLYGGAGNDTLWGSNGGGVLVGGDGNDTLNARNSRNILIGGQGSDTLNGALGNNILIAGFTVYDAHQRALDAVLKEWSSNATYAQRTARIEGASGGLNGVFSFSKGRVVDDNAVDSVLGDSGFNWYFTRETGNRKDSVLRRKAGEKTNKL